MVWWLILQVFTTLLEIAQLGRMSVSEKDLEMLLLRRQLTIYERKQIKAVRLSRSEKLTLVVLAVRLKAKTPGWRHLMTHYKDQLLACDFFTVEMLFLKTFYVLVFIEIGSRRVHFAGCTTKAWVTQQVRQMMWKLEEREQPVRFLIRDNDGKYSGAFDPIFRSRGIKVLATPKRHRMQTHIWSAG